MTGFGGNPGEGGSGMLRDYRVKPEIHATTSLSRTVEPPTQPSATRPDWADYFMEIAHAVARRGDCTRRQVGCVLVDADHRIIGTGYNGAEPGGPSCLRGECPRGRLTQEQRQSGTGGYDDCVAIHAEANALLFARTSCKGATAYVSSEVCPGCAKLLRGAGVVRVISGPRPEPPVIRHAAVGCQACRAGRCPGHSAEGAMIANGHRLVDLEGILYGIRQECDNFAPPDTSFKTGYPGVPVAFWTSVRDSVDRGIR